jgi:hypothetical protein
LSDYRYKVHAAMSNASPSEISPMLDAAAASPRPSRVRHDMPIAVSPSQAYYWKQTWQQAENEALAEIEAGKAHVFSGAEAAIRYLLGHDDE